MLIRLFTSVRIRENATNERDRGEPRESQEAVTQLKGSAPLELEALNYSSPGAFYYNWTLSTDKQYKSLVAKMKDRDFRYTFTEKGTYYLKVEVSNGSITEEDNLGCTQRKEFTIEVLESALDVPTVFTPNGDGKNDLFKVSYKSIIKFHGSVYNTWGRLVYDWDDPSNMINLLETGNGNNDGKYSSAEFDKYVNLARMSTNVEEHYNYLHEAEQVLLNDAAMAPVAYYNDFWLQKKNLKGTWHCPYGYWYLMYGHFE